MSARRGQRHAGSMGRANSAPSRKAASVVIVTAVFLLLSALIPMASSTATGQLRAIAMAVQRFLLFYSGVFALVALTAAVGAGLLAADQVVMSPGRRVVTQAMHRALSVLALAALFNHITFEIVAHRARAADAVVPFLAQRQTLYMGLGTIATDLFVVVILTGTLRKKFAAGSRPWVWRTLHAAAYLAWPMAILHGLLAGRAAKPYVDWSYGGCLAAVGLALTIRWVATLRGRRQASEPAPEPFSPSARGPSAMAAGSFSGLGAPSLPAWTGSRGPVSPLLAPRALAAQSEQPPTTQPWPGQEAPDGRWPGADYRPWIRTFPGEEN